MSNERNNIIYQGKYQMLSGCYTRCGLILYHYILTTVRDLELQFKDVCLSSEKL